MILTRNDLLSTTSSSIDRVQGHTVMLLPRPTFYMSFRVITS